MVSLRDWSLALHEVDCEQTKQERYITLTDYITDWNGKRLFMNYKF